MVHTEIPANDVRISAHPGQGEVVVITRYGKPEYVVLRWDDFIPIEQLIDRYLVNPPYDLEASDLAVRAAEISEAPEADDFDFSGLADALKQ